MFKQQTAYELRISDWSSDVCSSDLASAIPLCRTMARTRNSVLLQKAQFRTWIARGIVAGQSVGAGHIRWGKAIKGLTGRLGEFPARSDRRTDVEGQSV